MKRYILLSVWCALFFSAMNFGMQDETKSRCVANKPPAKISHPLTLEEIWKKREIEMEMNAMGFMTLEQANREKYLPAKPNYSLLPGLIEQELKKIGLNVGGRNEK